MPRWRCGTAERAAGRPRFVWLGRMSPEKRLLPFLEAVAESGIDADVEIIGGGGQEKAARRLVAEAETCGDRSSFAGRMPYAETLRRIAAADAVVQTSIGFETQGMTVFEAASLGTPAIVCDPDIGAELGSGFWAVADASTSALADALRTAAAQIAAGTGAEARSVHPRALPPVVAHGGDGRGLHPRLGLNRRLRRNRRWSRRRARRSGEAGGVRATRGGSRRS